MKYDEIMTEKTSMGCNEEQKKRDAKYDEIMGHPHYEPRHHPRMTREMRAAQFAPYAALRGHDAAIRRTAYFAELRTRRIIEPNLEENLEILGAKEWVEDGEMGDVLTEDGVIDDKIVNGE